MAWWSARGTARKRTVPIHHHSLEEHLMSIIPEPLRSQIEEAARLLPDMNIPNNDDPVDDENPAETGENENR